MRACVRLQTVCGMRLRVLIPLPLVMLILGCSPVAEARSDVPVTVSTVSRLAPASVDLTVDGNGSVLFVSMTYNAVYRVTGDASSLLLPGSGNSSTGATDGVGSAATFCGPYGLTCDTINTTARVKRHILQQHL